MPDRVSISVQESNGPCLNLLPGTIRKFFDNFPQVFAEKAQLEGEIIADFLNAEEIESSEVCVQPKIVPMITSSPKGSLIVVVLLQERKGQNPFRVRISFKLSGGKDLDIQQGPLNQARTVSRTDVLEASSRVRREGSSILSQLEFPVRQRTLAVDFPLSVGVDPEPPNEPDEEEQEEEPEVADPEPEELELDPQTEMKEDTEPCLDGETQNSVIPKAVPVRQSRIKEPELVQEGEVDMGKGIEWIDDHEPTNPECFLAVLKIAGGEATTEEVRNSLEEYFPGKFQISEPSTVGNMNTTAKVKKWVSLSTPRGQYKLTEAGDEHISRIMKISDRSTRKESIVLDGAPDMNQLPVLSIDPNQISDEISGQVSGIQDAVARLASLRSGIEQAEAFLERARPAVADLQRKIIDEVQQI